MSESSSAGPSLFVSKRRFRVWLFTASHATLLLRSVKGEGEATRIDLLFKPVRHMNLPFCFEGVDVRIVPRDGVERVQGGVARCMEAGDHMYALSPMPDGPWVIARTMNWHEDDGDYGDPSHFGVPQLVW